MIYTTIDTFYLSEEELKNSPSRRDGIDETSEMNLRFFGAELIQQAGILLKLPQAVMVTGQVLLHRFYCKKSFMKFNVKRVAASCLFLAGKLEENPCKIRDLLYVFHRMEQRRENQPFTFLEIGSKQYDEMRTDLIRTERHLLKEMGFICHVEHPHKFILSYLNQLNVFDEDVRQVAWNVANDSLRSTLCVRFKSENIACGIVYFVTRKFCIPLPENPPWWTAFDSTKKQILEVCKTLIWLYSQPKAQYISVNKDDKSFVLSTRAWEPPPAIQNIPILLNKGAVNPEAVSVNTENGHVESPTRQSQAQSQTQEKEKEKCEMGVESLDQSQNLNSNAKELSTEPENAASTEQSEIEEGEYTGKEEKPLEKEEKKMEKEVKEKVSEGKEKGVEVTDKRREKEKPVEGKAESESSALRKHPEKAERRKVEENEKPEVKEKAIEEEKSTDDKRKRKRILGEREVKDEKGSREKDKEREKEKGDRDREKDKEPEKERKDQRVGKYIVNYSETSTLIEDHGDRRVKRMRVKDVEYERRDVFSRLKFDERDKERERDRDRDERDSNRFHERLRDSNRDERGHLISNRDRERRAQMKEREKYRSHPYKR